MLGSALGSASGPQLRAQPEPRAQPNLLRRENGEAEPRLTSGGTAVARQQRVLAVAQWQRVLAAAQWQLARAAQQATKPWWNDGSTEPAIAEARPAQAVDDVRAAAHETPDRPVR